MRYTTALIMVCIIGASCKKNIDAYTDITSLTQLLEWGAAPFNSFTDLIRYKENYYCVFREGESHTSYDGKLRILISADGNKWHSFSLLTEDGEDLRDPHFFVDDNNVLSIATNAREANDSRKTIIYKLQDENFIHATDINVDNEYFLWSFSKFKNKLYSIGYNTRQPCFSAVSNQKSKLALFNSTNAECTSFSTVAANNLTAADFQCPNEASTVCTPDSTMITIVRDAPDLGASHIGISKYPFTNWTWRKFPYYVRGPKLALLPDGRLFLCAASLIDLYKTYYVIIDPKKNFAVEKMKIFPSAGDSGYPGVIIEGNTALVSYYSSHSGYARVYIDRFVY